MTAASVIVCLIVMETDAANNHMPSTMRWLLILQIAVYFNVFLSLPWILTHVYALSIKYGSLSETSKFLSVTGYSTMFLLEYPRLAVGYFGNLFQRPPLLMAFWLITVLIHVPIQTLLLFAAGMRQLPIEVVLDAVIFLFLMVEAAAGLMAVRKTILKIMTEVSSRNGEQSPVVAKD